MLTVHEDRIVIDGVHVMTTRRHTTMQLRWVGALNREQFGRVLDAAAGLGMRFVEVYSGSPISTGEALEKTLES